MAETTEKSYWIINESGLLVLGRAAGARLDGTFDSINKTSDFPLRLYAAATPNASLYIGAVTSVMGDGGAKAPGPIQSIIPNFIASSIDFQAQTTSGGSVSVSFPASSLGFFRRAAFSFDVTGTMIVSFSAESASIGALTNPGSLFIADTLPVGWVDLECTHVSGRFKTALSLTNVIENAVGGVPRIVRIAAGGGGGSGGSNTGYAQEIPLTNGTDTVTVTFPTPLLSTHYIPTAQLVNLVDPNPQFQTVIVTNKTVNGFTATWNAPLDSGNYLLDYLVPSVQEQMGEKAIGIGDTTVTVPLPIAALGTNYVVIAQLVNYTDGAPQFQPVTVTTKTAPTFSVSWNAPTDTVNYLLSWHVAAYA